MIVDQGFVDLVMGGRNPIGHRVRLGPGQVADSNAAPLPWYEIVGVVKELGMASAAMPQREAGVYLPVVPGSQGALKMIVHGRGDPLSIAPRVRELAMAVDPAIRVEQMTRLDQVTTPLLWLLGLWTKIIIGLTAVALLLSLAGIYAVLSYTVARRTREIGVRVALGAGARRVITSIFRRPLTQVTLGVIAGIVLIVVAAIGGWELDAVQGDRSRRADARRGRAARRVRDPDARCLHPRLRRAYRPCPSGAADGGTEGGMIAATRAGEDRADAAVRLDVQQ